MPRKPKHMQDLGYRPQSPSVKMSALCTIHPDHNMNSVLYLHWAKTLPLNIIFRQRLRFHQNVFGKRKECINVISTPACIPLTWRSFTSSSWKWQIHMLSRFQTPSTRLIKQYVNLHICLACKCIFLASVGLRLSVCLQISLDQNRSCFPRC